jgi:hypothetical protein
MEFKTPGSEYTATARAISESEISSLLREDAFSEGSSPRDGYGCRKDRSGRLEIGWRTTLGLPFVGRHRCLHHSQHRLTLQWDTCVRLTTVLCDIGEDQDQVWYGQVGSIDEDALMLSPVPARYRRSDAAVSAEQRTRGKRGHHNGHAVILWGIATYAVEVYPR